MMQYEYHVAYSQNKSTYAASQAILGRELKISKAVEGSTDASQEWLNTSIVFMAILQIPGRP